MCAAIHHHAAARPPRPRGWATTLRQAAARAHAAAKALNLGRPQGGLTVIPCDWRLGATLEWDLGPSIELDIGRLHIWCTVPVYLDSVSR